MFGNHTFGRVGDAAWKHGYEPLATLDTNKDGSLKGSELSSVWVWLDTNSNALVDQGEMKPSTDYVKSLAVKAKVDAAGNAEAPIGAELLNGKSVPTWDWWSKAWTLDLYLDTVDWKDATNSDGVGYLIPTRISRSLPIRPALVKGVAHVYHWAKAGDSHTSGYFRFIPVGEDLYVVGAAGQTSLQFHGGDETGKGGIPYYQLPFAKVTKRADGSLSWRFDTATGTSYDETTVTINNGTLIGESKWFYKSQLRMDYKWVATPLVQAEVDPYFTDDSLGALYGALGAFSSVEFAKQVGIYPNSVSLNLTPPRGDYEKRKENLPLLRPYPF